ncbi:MAG: Lrp/AsnC family transcriptional regulator [Candidatus Hydrogenedentota bacterium]
MVTAIILAHVKRSAINETAQALLEIEGVAEVYSIAGEWDLAIIVRAKDNDQLADIVTNHLLKLDGIEKTTTLIGFRAYSNYDLDRMFSLGFEGPGG